MPDSATLTTSAGSRPASRPNVPGSTSRVFRLRALTPISVGADGQRALDLVLVVHLDERGHPELAGLLVQVAQQRVVERGDDQQHQVGAGGAGLEHLVAGDDEVLAQHRASSTAARTARRSSRLPPNRRCSVSTEIASAPPAAYAVASAAGSGMSAQVALARASAA